MTGRMAGVAVPPRCIILLDLGTKYGECDELLRSGEFTCDHDFCPTCDIANEGYQAHQCDLSCGFCPDQAPPCPEPEEADRCVNRLDMRCASFSCLPVPCARHTDAAALCWADQKCNRIQMCVDAYAGLRRVSVIF